MATLVFLFLCGILSVNGERCHKKCISDEDCNHDNNHYCSFDTLHCNSECTATQMDLPPPVIGMYLWYRMFNGGDQYSDLPPSVIGRKRKNCVQLPGYCHQSCMVTYGGCTTCDCALAAKINPMSAMPIISGGIASAFNNAFGTPQQSSLSSVSNPGNTNQMNGQSGSLYPAFIGQQGSFNPANPGRNNPGNTGQVANGQNNPAFMGAQTGQGLYNGKLDPSHPGGSNGGAAFNPLQNVTPQPTAAPTTPTPAPTTAGPTTTASTTSAKPTCAPVRCVAPCNKGVAISKLGCPVCLCQ